MKKSRIMAIVMASAVLAVMILSSTTYASYPWWAYDQRSAANPSTIDWTQTISEQVTAQAGENLNLNNYWYNNKPSTTMSVKTYLTRESDNRKFTHSGSSTIGYHQGLMEYSSEATASGTLNNVYKLYSQHYYQAGSWWGLSTNSDAKKFKLINY